MPKVFLVGDSVRMGYDRYVRDHFSGQAEVYYPADNCRFAQYVLRHFHEWVEKECDPKTVNVVHWNAGLWDTGRLFEDEPLTPLDAYVEMLRRVSQRIRVVCPGARQIFATSTPVVEAQYAQPERFFRYNADIVRYNQAACALMETLGVAVNDLHAVASRLPGSAWSDATHLYTETGTRALGEAVCAAIRAALGT
ncbi:MAG: hypothetical protein PUD50_11835 [Eubacteriales bacterium]|nr:hypothetical protein [Eubacteriales bacterium]